MTGRVTQSLNAVDLRDPIKQPPQRPYAAIGPFAMIGVNVLTNERDLADASCGQMRHLGDDLFHRPGDFCAARVGYNAEGAELVAALLHGDKSRGAARADRGTAGRRQVIEFILEREFGIDGLAPAFGAGHQFGKPMIILRAKDQIDRWCAANDLLAFGLRDAASDRYK